GVYFTLLLIHRERRLSGRLFDHRRPGRAIDSAAALRPNRCGRVLRSISVPLSSPRPRGHEGAGL
ncbi:hypothetical protein CSHISOI_10917, partial [Colletotrichum shisoi]